MKNNFYNIKDNWYKEFDNTFNTMNSINDINTINKMNINNMNDMNYMNNMNSMNMNKNLADPKEAFLRGNLFNNLYDPYKNYKYGMLNPTNKKEELLFNILMYKFVLKELNLYLDNYPNDTNMLNQYNKYLLEEKKLCDQYEKSYGPLTTDSQNLGNNSWRWIKSPWPWEGTK